jgi:glycosyltransferase involved in cell wall biosynthesis
MSSPRIIFYAGGMEAWAPPSLIHGGIGGSETACIHIADLFARAGWLVDVYGQPGHYEGLFNGVAYLDRKRLPVDAQADVFVSWRQPEAWRVPVKARVTLCWCHDYTYTPESGPDLARYDRVLGVSRWHRDSLARMYGLENTDYVPNGIDLALFPTDVPKTHFQCVWSSSPDRDLELLLNLWPRITATEPMATLQIAYGWQGIDARIRQGDQNAAGMKDRIERKIDALPGVTWHGRIGQDALAKIKCASWLAPYDTAFLEVSAISMLENLAAGCVPVTSDSGALPETVGDGGYVIPGSPYSRTQHEMFVRVCQAVLGEANARVSKVIAGRERAKEFTWAKSFERWEAIIAALLEPDTVQDHSLTGVAP